MKRTDGRNYVVKIDNDTLSSRETFEHILNNFRRNQGDVFSVTETIILSSILVERIVRQGLTKINPVLMLDKIDVENIAILSNKKQKLLNKTERDEFDVNTASISILLDRFLKFYEIKVSDLELRSFISMRNKIVHSVRCVPLESNRVSILLTKSIFPFIYGHINVKDSLWNDIKKIAIVADNTFRRKLLTKIIQHRRLYDSLIKTRATRNHSVELDGTETILEKNLLCPGCQQETMAFITGVDFDYSDHETVPFGYLFSKCPICKLELGEYETEEIIKNNSFYFSPNDDQLKKWTSSVLSKEDI